MNCAYIYYFVHVHCVSGELMEKKKFSQLTWFQNKSSLSSLTVMADEWKSSLTHSNELMSWTENQLMSLNFFSSDYNPTHFL